MERKDTCTRKTLLEVKQLTSTTVMFYLLSAINLHIANLKVALSLQICIGVYLCLVGG